MTARVLFVTDLHKRDTDLSSIVGYTNATDAVQRDILAFIKQHEITHLVSTGDWYDKGYRNVNRLFNDINFDARLAEAVNGNFYMCLGNHFFLERDSNPEMYLVQPNDKHKPVREVMAIEPVIKVPNNLRIGEVQISLFHFSKDNKMYTAEREPGVVYHVGVYHDVDTLPSGIREKAYAGGSQSNTKINAIYDNIDLAIHGHIHTPIGIERVAVGAKQVPLIIPGSLAITMNKASEIHPEVSLPVLYIENTGKPMCKMFTFSLHMELMKRYDRKREAHVADLTDVGEVLFTEPRNAVTLEDYLTEKGYKEKYIKLMRTIREQEMSPFDVIKALGEENVG
jgi:Icc-related predicted phosphoesterase